MMEAYALEQTLNTEIVLYDFELLENTEKIQNVEEEIANLKQNNPDDFRRVNGKLAKHEKSAVSNRKKASELIKSTKDLEEKQKCLKKNKESERRQLELNQEVIEKEKDPLERNLTMS